MNFIIAALTFDRNSFLVFISIKKPTGNFRSKEIISTSSSSSSATNDL